MSKPFTRRGVLKGGSAWAGLAALGLADWNLPAVAQGEEVVPFTDVPERFKVTPATPGRLHFLDTREIDSFYTPNDDFYLVQHYGQPEIDLEAYRLKVTGLVERPREYTLAELKQRERVEQDVGFECGGNSNRILHGLIGNARWAGLNLAALLKESGVKPEGKEVVFFGADTGTEELRRIEVEQNFARSLSIDDAMRPEVMLAYGMNGDPLPETHGAPLRLIVPGWYGVANVKWVTQIHVQDRRFMGRFMGRDYVTLQKSEISGQNRWTEHSVTQMLLKSVIIRVTRRGDRHTILGFVLNDGTPLKTVEVRIDNQLWKRAKIDERSTQYSWKLFTYEWEGATSGEHTIVSRVVDSKGNVQPLQEEMPEKATIWENNGQFPRKVMIS